MSDLTEKLLAMKPSGKVPEKGTMKEKHPKPKAEKKSPQGKKEKFIVHSYDEIIRETDKAVLFRVNNNCFWLPKSKMEILDDSNVRAPHWLRVTLRKVSG